MRALLLSTLILALTAQPLAAQKIAVAPDVQAASLPALGTSWLATNPYRNQPVADEARAIGRDAYNQACARCHGVDASTNAAPAPDLRKLDRGCRRITEPALKARCQADNDAYFARTVRQGKVILGVTHMPPWQGVLSQELAWAIQVFIESRAAAR